MEDFWQNILDFSSLMIKVVLIMWLVDIMAVFLELEFRVPYLSYITDWIFAKIAVLA